MDLWVFDNDRTLYNDSVARVQFFKIFFRYFSRLAGITEEQAPDEVARLKNKWGTEVSILTVVKEFGIGFAEVVSNTYLKIKLEECDITAPDMTRLNVLNSIKSRKVVFTNNPLVFARRVLSYNGLLDCFDDCIGIEEIGFCGKPDNRAYKVVEDRHKGFDRIIFCDDSLKNLKAARELGWVTVWCKLPNMDPAANQDHLIIESFEGLLRLAQ